MAESTKEIQYGGRRSGRTYRQIENAPRDAIFVVHTSDMKHYAMDIAKEMGRGDILIKNLYSCLHGELQGTNRFVEIDHACWDYICFINPVGSDEFLEGVRYLNAKNTHN